MSSILHIFDCTSVKILVVAVVLAALLDLFSIFRISAHAHISLKNIFIQYVVIAFVVGIMSYIMHRTCGTTIGNVIGYGCVALAMIALFKSIYSTVTLEKALKQV